MQRKIKFIGLEIEGFFSIIKPINYQLDRTGLNLLQGPNGSGKTTTLSALPWGLFGIDLKGRRNPEPWEAIKPKKFKGTKVSITFEVNNDSFEVIRMHKYKDKVDGVKGGSRVILKINSKTCEGYRDKGDYNKAIIDILGMDYTVMVNSIIFGQNLKTLVEEKGAKRKQVFDELFRVDYINKAKDLALKQRTELESEIKELEHKRAKMVAEKELAKSKRANIKTKIKNYEDRKSELSDKIKEAEQKLKNTRGYEKEISQLDKKLSKDDRNQKKLKKLKKELDKLERQELTLSLKLPDIKYRPDELASEIRELMGRKIVNDCSKCGQPIPKKEVEKQKKDKKYEIKALKAEKKAATIHKKEKVKEYNSLLASIDVKRAEIKELKKTNKGRESLIRRKANLESELSAVKELSPKIKSWNKKLKELKKPSVKKLDKLRKTINKCEKALKSINIAELQGELSVYDWAIKTPLSNSGIKAYIFNERLEAVNDRLEHYSPYIGLQPRFEVNINSARKDIDIKLMRFGQEVKYQDLSGGQAQLVDVIALLSIHDVFSESVDCNILITDEIFKYLDTENIEIVSELLKVKSKDKANHVITHHSNLRIRNAFITNFILKDGRTGLAV